MDLNSETKIGNNQRLFSLSLNNDPRPMAQILNDISFIKLIIHMGIESRYVRLSHIQANT